jgi:hypothetical protein
MEGTFLLTRVTIIYTKYLHISDIIAGYPSSAFVIHPFDKQEIASASASDKIHIRKFNQ